MPKITITRKGLESGFALEPAQLPGALGLLLSLWSPQRRQAEI